MAKGRVGGTKAKIRGQVGSTIYQLKKADDGSYVQHSYAKGERVESEPSARLQAHRMCMAMVESLMNDLQPVASISFETWGGDGQSINAFSSKNVAKVCKDCREHWYEDNQFVYPYYHRSDIATRDLGGAYIISHGSCAENVFDDEIFSDYAARDFQGVHDQSAQFGGILFRCTVGQTTLGDLLKAHRMTRYDIVCFVFFREWIDFSDPEDPKEYERHEYMIATINGNIPDTQLITPEILPGLFVMQSSVQMDCLAARDNSAIVLGRLTDVADSDEKIYYQASFSISYYTGVKRITKSEYHFPEGGTGSWLLGHAPADVFASWMQSQNRGVFPSPYGTKK